MARIFDLTEALKDLIPVVDGWPLHMQVEPLAGELPPWVMVTITNDGIIRNEIGGAIAIPALQGVIPKCDGFACSCLTLAEDSGAYAAGLTETDTAYRYRVRVLRFDFTWSRHDSP